MKEDYTRAPIVGGNPAPQVVLATAASTTAVAIAGNGTGGALYEFVAAGNAHVAFGLSTLADAAVTDRLVTTSPVRFWIDPTLATHVKAIRSTASAADVPVTFQRVR